MIKEAMDISIETLLTKDDKGNKFFYRIPPYQREYSWGEEQWENLYNDILENEEGYFLGSMICINDENKNYFEVIDGQQRLTTISILLNSILTTIYNYNKNNPNEKILDLAKNKSNTMIFLKIEEMLYKNTDINEPRLTLSIQKNNNKDYKYLLSNTDNPYQLPEEFGNGRISKAYEYFNERLLNDDNKIDIRVIFSFFNKLASAIIVKIDVGDVQSAFSLFENINNRGMQLTPIDLIKNYFISKIKEENPNDVNENDVNERWQEIVTNIESYDDQISFLRHFYHAFQNDKDIKIENFTKATKTNILEIYNQLINKNPSFILEELIEKSKIYTKFIYWYYEDDGNEFSEYKDKLYDLTYLGVVSSYAYLLYIFSDFKNEKFSDLLDFLENWFLRRHLTNYPSTNKLDQIFLDLINETNKNGYSFESVKSFLMQKDRYKSDDEFREFLNNANLYNENANALKCLLVKLEKSKRKKKNKIDFWEEKNGKLIWSIEHILPQKPKKNSKWCEWFNKEDMKENLHRIGNLTLTCHNSVLSNKEFNEKLSIEKKGIKVDIGLKSGNIKINDYIKDKQNEIWDKNDIESRGKWLVDDIMKLIK